MKKNINPKSLKGQDKLNRMLDLMGKMNTLNESKTFSELELIKKGPNGIVYGIIRENHDYFIKYSEKKSGNFLAEDFNYIGGLQNKYDERYKSYAEAIKQLNLKFDMLNESYGIDTNTNIFESDGIAFGGGVGFGFVMEDEEEEEEESKILSDSNDEIEEQKKVIKVDAPKSEEPKVEEPIEDEVDVDMGGDIADMDFGDDEPVDSEEDNADDSEKDDETKKIQKYTGKIGQLLRDMKDVDSDLEKYVINSIISAMHLDKMDEGDKEDIISKLEGEEEDSEILDLDTEEKPEETEDTTSNDDTEEELSENEEISTKKEVLNVTEKQMDMLHDKGICECGDKCLVYRESDVKDSVLLDKIAQTKKECVFITKSQMDMLHKEGKCDCGDVTLKYNKKESTNEGRIFSKKQLMESFIRRTTKNTLKSVLKERRELCEECGSRMINGVCNECEINEDFMSEKLIGRQSKIDKNRNGRIDAEDFKMLRRNRDERKNTLDEEEMSVMDAISTGQGYLNTTKELDRDFDGIPNRLDMDNNDDGKVDNSIDDDFIELDIDFLLNNNPGTKEKEKERTITRPGEGDKWRRIKRPKVDPRPKAENDDFMRDIKPSHRRRGMFR